MRREVSISIFAVLIIVAAILTVYYLNVGPTGFVVFSQADDASFFGAGNYTSYENVTWNGSAVVLAANQTSGTYTSKVLDANSSSATWNLTVNKSGVTFEVTACSTANCSDANFTTINNLNPGQYFQYRASFDSINDTLGSVAIDYTVAQQATPLSVSVSTPAGQEYKSLSAIPLTFTIAGGTGTNLTCLYNINYAGNELVSNTSITCANGANTKTFDLPKKGGDNILTIYVSDNSGSASASSPVFQVSLPAGGITGAATEGVTNETPVEVLSVTQVFLGEVSAQDINQGNSGQFTVPLQNTGTVPLTSCTLRGDDSGWFSITGGAINLNAGEGSTYSFSVNVPEDAGVEAHTLGLSVDCAEAEATASQTFTVNVLQKKLNFNITNVQRTREDRVRVDYSLTELAGEDQDVQILFGITDASGLQVANTSQNSSINANQTDDFRVNIPINESLEGNLILSAAFNSQVYSSSVLEPITLGAPIGGFAIFAGVGGAGGVIILVVVVLVLIVIFFIARKMRQSGKGFGDLLGSKE